jgi:hypothetical protein
MSRINFDGLDINIRSEATRITSIGSPGSTTSERDPATAESRGATETVTAASATALFAATTKVTRTAAAAFSKSHDRLPALSQLPSYTHHLITTLFFSFFFINVLLLFLWVPLVLDVVFQHQPTSFFRSRGRWRHGRWSGRQEEQEECFWDDSRLREAIVQCVWAEKENTAAAA